MADPIWVRHRLALAIHEEQLAEHGGLSGLRDEGALRSALMRPVDLFFYGNEREHAVLAAAYGFGIAGNHPFVDGNRRMSLTVCLTFLGLNGIGVQADDDDKVATWLALAGGSLGQDDLAVWLRERLRPA